MTSFLALKGFTSCLILRRAYNRLFRNHWPAPLDHQSDTAIYSSIRDNTQNLCLGKTINITVSSVEMLYISKMLWTGQRTRSPSSSGSGGQVKASWAAVFAFLPAQMLALINKHYLKDPSSPVKCPLRGWLAPASQGTEYLIIALNE